MSRFLQFKASSAGQQAALPLCSSTVQAYFVRMHPVNTCIALQGARRDGMLKEMASYDTIGNAFFALTIHAVPLRWRYVSASILHH